MWLMANEKDGGDACELRCEPEHEWGGEMGSGPRECGVLDTMLWGGTLRSLQVTNWKMCLLLRVVIKGHLSLSEDKTWT